MTNTGTAGRRRGDLKGTNPGRILKDKVPPGAGGTLPPDHVMTRQGPGGKGRGTRPSEFMPEREEDLHFLWENLHFERDRIVSDTGKLVRVLDPGKLNHNQGPDFLNARVEIDGLVFHGHVELHLRSGEWYRHGHQSDPGYNNVILHVVMAPGDRPVTRSDGTVIPEISLQGRIDPRISRNISGLRCGKDGIPCRSWLEAPQNALPPHLKAILGQRRLKRKAELMRSRVRDLTGNWEQVIWEELAGIMGGPVNGGSFRALAVALPWKVVRRYLGRSLASPYFPEPVPGAGHGSLAADPGRSYPGTGTFATADADQTGDGHLSLEALLFGMAGFLEDPPLLREPWPLRLRLEWAYLARKHHLKPVRVPFHFHRMRPGGFPTIRLAQLGRMLHSVRDPVALLDPRVWPSFRNAEIDAGRFWKNHLRFGERRRARPRQLGTAFKELVIVNVLAPLALLYEESHGGAGWGGPAGDPGLVPVSVEPETGPVPGVFHEIRSAMEGLPPEDNRILRTYAGYGETPSNALEAQGLLELHKEFCTRGRCLSCPFGQAIVAGNLAAG